MSFASVNGVALHYRVTGAEAKNRLILVNSLGTNLHIWDEVIERLAPTFRILSYDLRGHGLSDAPPGPYTIDDHVADVLGLADTCGFSSFDLCGISIGGMIGMRIAARHSARVGRLVLCDTGATIASAAMWNERIGHVRQGGMSAVADAVMARWVAPGFQSEHPAQFAGWRNMVERCSPEGYIACCETLRDTDLTSDLVTITAPTLVVAGEHDIPTPPAAVRQLAAAIKGAEYRQIAGTGHVPSIEQPAVLAGLIREHLHEQAHV